MGLEILSRAAASLTVAAPPTRAIAPPGYYLLVVLDDADVPSMGRFIRVT